MVAAQGGIIKKGVARGGIAGETGGCVGASRTFGVAAFTKHSRSVGFLEKAASAGRNALVLLQIIPTYTRSAVIGLI